MNNWFLEKGKREDELSKRGERKFKERISDLHNEA